MASIQRVTVNYLEHPVGITGAFQLGWVLESDKRGAHQESYHFVIAEDPEFEKVVCDSGVVESSESAHIVVEENWKDIQKYHIKVQAVVSGEETEWAFGSFVSGYQNIAAWQGAFVTVETPEDANNSAGTYLRKTFCIEKKMKNAYLVSTAHGLYRAFINGTKVGKDEFAPGWTSYNKRLLYQTWEITDLLCEGENVLGVHLGAGWYKGEITYLHLRNFYGDRIAFGGQIVIDYEDGERQVVVSDESFCGSKSPVLFSEIYDGETYDARMEQDGWNQCGFDDKNWQPVTEVDQDIHTLVPQQGCPVEEMTKVEPISVITTPQGDTVIDFGQNMTGWCYITVEDAMPGDRVELNFFEVLDSAGNVYTENLRTAKETIVYFCRGAEKEVYHPHFTFQGFRYAKVASYPGEVKLENFTAWALHSAMRETGSFACSNPLINQLQHNILWGMKGNFLDVPTDCPQRDERLGWTGDAQIFCRTATFLMDTYTFYSKWLADLEADQAPNGAVPNVVPDTLTKTNVEDNSCQEENMGISAWADAAVIIPWNEYLAYGDKEILKRQYDSMAKWISFMENHSEEGCMFDYQQQLGDWVALDAEEGSYFGATPTDLTSAAYFCYSTGLMTKIAGILGKTEDEKHYQEMYQKLKASFAEHFFDEEGVLTAQTQTAHVVALYFHLVPEEYMKTTVCGLQRLLDAEDGHLVTGFIGTPYIAHALSENGCFKEAYELLLKEDFPSWLYQVLMGATTIWEHLDGLKPDGTMWSPEMNSFNHYAYGSIGEWLYRVVGGLEADEREAGYKHFYIQPLIGGGLDWTDLSYESIYGAIRIRWDRDGDVVKLTATIPVGVTADILLRQAREITDAEGLEVLPEKEGYCMKVEPGIYRIQFSI